MTDVLVKEQEMKNMIRKTVIESIQGVLTDPEYGSELSEKFAVRLNRESEEPSGKLKSLSEIKRKYHV